MSSGSHARVVLVPRDKLTETVTLARALIRRGVKASVSKDVAERLSEGTPALVEIPQFGVEFEQEVRPLGIDVAEPRPVHGDELAWLRKGLGLSQEQFANSLGLDVRTLQNWEQGRVSLEGPIALLVKLIGHYPHIVQRVAADDPTLIEEVELR